jgi:hypothetical protein
VLASRHRIKGVYACAKGTYKTTKKPPEHKCAEEDGKRKNGTKYQRPESNAHDDKNEGIEPEEEVLKKNILPVLCLKKKEDE